MDRVLHRAVDEHVGIVRRNGRDHQHEVRTGRAAVGRDVGDEVAVDPAAGEVDAGAVRDPHDDVVEQVEVRLVGGRPDQTDAVRVGVGPVAGYLEVAPRPAVEVVEFEAGRAGAGLAEAPDLHVLGPAVVADLRGVAVLDRSARAGVGEIGRLNAGALEQHVAAADGQARSAECPRPFVEEHYPAASRHAGVDGGLGRGSIAAGAIVGIGVVPAVDRHPRMISVPINRSNKIKIIAITNFTYEIVFHWHWKASP